MDVFRRQKFNEAMFAKNRTLAIRVGQYQSRDINEASFDYGYIKGDTYKPGGTCAGSAKIVFASVITSFNKLDKIYPEIGLLVDGTYEWVKMGEYFINDIEIDRNRKTTKLDLMDGMFKLNREHVTDLAYPAEIRNVIKEICLKTGIELANENMGLASMNYRIEQIPKDKKMTFRDVLSLATQMLGMSCFFNREGKLEIKELTDSGIVITADSYFMHGLTKSEIEYQIAGITCKKDKETLTVGLRTGRSLELDNLFMSQSILDNLYHSIKDIRYYPFSLNYQGHLLLDVGQWVTIKTNTGETFKSPVLSQSFNFKGGLRGRISADSKAGNDAQYSYAGTITKKIEQFNEFEAQLQNQIEEADRGFDAKVDQIKKDFDDQIELAKAKAEENKKALSDEIDRRFHEFSPAGFDEAKRKAEEALKKAGASADLIEEAKRIADSNTRDLNAFKTATQREREKLSNELKQYSREETQTQITQRFQDFTRDNEAKLVEYKQGIDGRFTTLASQIAGKVTQGGPNMLRNSRADDGLKYWTEADGRLGFTAHSFYFNGQKRMFELRPGAIVKSPRFIVKRNADYTLNILGFDNNSKYFRVYFCKRKKGSSADFEEKQLVFDGSPKWTNGPVFSNEKTVKKSFKFNVGDFDDGYLQFEYDRNNPNKWGGLFMTELDFYEGTNDRKWQPSPEDAEEGVTQKLAEYKETVDGRFATISSQISGKVDQSDFQRVKETSQLYERILGTTEQGVADNASRLVMSSQIFQTEVKKLTGSSYNLVFDPTNFSKWKKKQADANVIEVQAGTRLLRITNTGNTNVVYHGFALPLTTSTFTEGEKLSYRMEVWVDVLPDAPLGIELWAEDGGLASDSVTFTKTGIQIITGTMTVQKSSTKGREFPLEIWLMKNGTVAIGKVSLIRGETPPNEFKDDTSAQDVVAQTKVTQLSDSYAIQTLTNAGAIASQINTNANNILIEANKIRLKGKTLADEITAIDGYFKRLFVGDARIGKLNTDIIESNSITADKVIMDSAMAKKIVSSDVFTDQLAAKNAFINKLRSVVVSATLLEGYKGRIGGFQIGTHDKDPSVSWLTGINQFAVGMSNGSSSWGQTALWVNWGDNWNKPGDYAWYVKRTGEMYCYNQAHFWNTPVIHGNLKVSGNIYYITDQDTGVGGYWIHSPSYKRIQENAGYIYLYRFDDSYSWIPINKEISDRRYKHNIEDSKVSALEVIDNLKTYSYRKEYDGEIEDISCGIMAQDVQKYIPEAFYENPDGAYSYRAFELVPYLIKAIQELNQKLEKVNEGRN
jgi:putative uncharacterized protein (fragment)|nr:MAG TPA: Neck appendage protein [Caudoviricetes sp.]